jgi:CBS domain-containing protein
MASPIWTVAADATVVDAERLLREHEISSLVVVEGNRNPVGVVTRTDLLRAARASAHRDGEAPRFELPATPLRELMTRHILALAPDTPIAAAARQLVEHRVHRLFVRDGEELVGLISTKEIMRALLDARLAPPQADYMSRPVESVDVREPLLRAVERLRESGVTGLVVVEGGLPVGLFTQREALEAQGRATDIAVEDAMTQAMLALPQATPLFRAAGFTLSTSARRVLAVEHHQVKGIVTGLDFARAVADAVGPEPVAAIA